MKRFFTSLEALGALAAALAGGGVIPSIGAFTDLAPPFYSPICFVTSGVATCAIIYVCLRRKGFKVNLAITAIGICVLSLTGYAILFNTCTSVSPGEQSERFQIGFGKASWSLTPKGAEMKQKYPNDTIEDWMLKVGAYRPHGPELLWSVGTVILSGTLMMFVFLLGFSSWAFGWCVFARRLADARITLNVPPNS